MAGPKLLLQFGQGRELVVVDSLCHPEVELCDADNSFIDLVVSVFKIKLKVYNL